MKFGERAMKNFRRIARVKGTGIFDGLVGREFQGWVRGRSNVVAIQFGPAELDARVDLPRADLISLGIDGLGFSVSLRRLEEMTDDLIQVGDCERYSLLAKNPVADSLLGSSTMLRATELRTLLSLSVAMNVLGARKGLS